MEIRTVKHIAINDLPEDIQADVCDFVKFYYGGEVPETVVWNFAPAIGDDNASEDSQKEFAQMVDKHHRPVIEFLTDNGIAETDEVWIEL